VILQRADGRARNGQGNVNKIKIENYKTIKTHVKIQFVRYNCWL